MKKFNMNGFITSFASIFALCLVFSSCGKKNWQSFDKVGIKFERPELFQTYAKNLSMTEVGEKGDCGVIVDFIADDSSDVYPLFIIASIDADVISEDEFHREVGGGVAFLEKLNGSSKNSRYFVSYDVDKFASMLNVSKDALPSKYLELLDTLPQIQKSIKFYTPVKAYPADNSEEQGKVNLSDSKFNFSSMDLDGKSVDASIFSSADITLVNVWGTFCGPCISEMPELALLSEELKAENCQIVGFICDVTEGDSEGISLAKDILADSGVKYTNVLYNKDIDSFLGIQAVPTSLLVDSEGNILGESILGARSKEEYAKRVRSAAGMVK